MDTCASADSFRLRFESCSPAGGSGQARTDDYRCLAEWTNKQGRTYFVAQLQTGDDAQVDVSETFRCFVSWNCVEMDTFVHVYRFTRNPRQAASWAYRPTRRVEN
ncbi:unnamed protein product [Sphagnum balticum]